jgi:hypothetical protein
MGKKEVTMKRGYVFLGCMLTCGLGLGVVSAEEEKDLGKQFGENPPLQVISKTPPVPATITDTFEVREGFTLIKTLDEFRVAIKRDNQKIRMKPGIYRAEKVDPPLRASIPRAKPDQDGKLPKNHQEHIFAVNGSNNYFDLRGAVFETPVSGQSKLSGRAHVADTWHINGAGNTFEGGYFRNVIDKPYPQYRVTENELEVCNDNNTFLNCGGRKGLKNSTVTNYTTARLILNERVRNCVIKSVGPVEGSGRENTIIKIKRETKVD